MDGKGRPGVLSVWSPDPVLSVLAPLGLALSARTCLVVDLVGDLQLRAERTMADLLSEGPRLDELSPGRDGVVMMAAGPVTVDALAELVEAMSASWSAIVVRAGETQWPGATVPVMPLFPGLLATTRPGAAVWQTVAGSGSPPGPGPVLPRLSGRVTRALLGGRRPAHSRWVAAWRRVWDLPWA